MIEVHVGLLEVGGEARVEGIELEGPLVQEGILAQGLEEVEPIPAGGLASDLKDIEVAIEHQLSHLLDEGFCARLVVVHGEAWEPFLALAIHHTDGVGLAVDVNAHQ